MNQVSGHTSAINDSLDVTAEDIKYIRDAAEQEAINRFTTAEIKVEQTNHNTISSESDLAGIISGITEMTTEAAMMAAEGV